jgi:HK97 family phage major capsid protein
MADISRSDVATLIQEEYSSALLDTAAAQSAALSAFENVPLGTKITNLPVLTSLPQAAWVSENSAAGAAGTKPTSEATWGNKQFVVEEVAVIIPIHEDVLDDATEDLLARLTTMGGTAIGKTLDEAVFVGLNKPATWLSPDLFAAATAAGQLFQVGAGADDLGGSILQAAGAVADNGAEPSTIFTSSGLRYRLANLRANDGSTVFIPSLNAGVGTDNIFGLDAQYLKNGAWNTALATAIIADKDRVKIGVRQDITVKFLDQATVNGINLAEKDMVALRFKARYAYVLGNTIGADGLTSKPIAAVTPAGA